MDTATPEHPNARTSTWYAHYATTAERCKEERPIGEVLGGSMYPFLARRVGLEVRQVGQGVEWRERVIPASPAEAAAYWERAGTYAYEPGESELDVRVTEACRVAAELWQESWFAGVPSDRTILCHACQRERQAHGSNRYDEVQLCNRCVREVEVLMAQGALASVEVWAAECAGWNSLRHAITQAEAQGVGYFQLPGERWLEVHPLYQFTRHQELSPYDHVEDHWPYADVRPVAYHGYVRSGWQPGDYFNSPDEEIYFTSYNRLFDFLSSGGQLPPDTSPDPRRSGRGRGGRLRRRR